MRVTIILAFMATVTAGLSATADAHDDFHGGRRFHPGFHSGFGIGGYGYGGYGVPVLGYGYPGFGGGYSTFGYGFAPGYQTVVSTTTFYQPALVPPVYYGGGPYQLGALGYPYRFYTQAPGYSFSYFSGTVPTYYPGQFGYGYGYYGYGPFGW